MITDIGLFLIIIAQVALYAYEKRENRILWDKYMNAMKAKNATELRDLEMVKKVEVKTSVPPPQNDLIPTGEASEKEFLEAIRAS